MPDLQLQRIVFTTEADVILRMLKARTGITPNLLCRMAFTLSLEEPGLPAVIATTAERSPREINRYTLLGEYDRAYVALLYAWLALAGADLQLADEYFVAHVHRGIGLLASRLKSLPDCQGLLQQQAFQP